MNDLTIRQIVARGPGKADSIIDLEPGVNVILGPSNTGKSMMVDCIDYLFGGEKPPLSPNETGYSSVSMTLANDQGEGFSVSRDITLKDDEAKPASTVIISSSISGVESGSYQAKLTKAAKWPTYGDILLGLLGIRERLEIISTQAGKSITFTPRVFFHQFCLKEGEIFKEQSVIENISKGNTITSDINALAYLLYEGGVSTEKHEDPEILEAKKNAVVAYIGGKSSTFSERREFLELKIAEVNDVNVDETIESIIQDSVDIENKIAKARNESQAMLSEIYRESQKLEEARFLQERYHKLHTQYDSDVQRLQFIIEGETNSEADTADHCPFCDATITSVEDRGSYIQASKAEMDKVQQQIADLGELEKEVSDAIVQREASLAALRQRKSSVQSLISTSFQPKMNELRSELGRYQSIVGMKQELALLESLGKELQDDMYDKLVQDPDTPKYDAKKTFRKDYFDELAKKVAEAIKQCKYPDYRVAWISDKTFDVAVNKKDKKSEGKGYRAFLNTIFAFTIMKFIEARGMHAPKMLILDSPVLSLKESEGVPISDSMKSALFTYLIKNCGTCQLIIAENELPDSVDYSNINLIKFTQGLNGGRYGFLQDLQPTSILT